MAKEKLADRIKKIDTFMGFEELDLGRKWHTHDEIEKVVAKIIYLGYNCTQMTFIHAGKVNYVTNFVKAGEPYTTIHSDGKCKSRLDALTQAILLFIDKYNTGENGESIQEPQTV